MIKSIRKSRSARLCIVAAILLSAVIIHSCKKDNNLTTVNSNQTTLEMQQWLFKQKTDTLKAITINQLLNQIIWQTAHTLTTDSGKVYELADISTINTFDDPSKVQLRCLVLQKENNKIINGFIYEFFGDKTDIINKTDELVSGYNQININNFNGTIAIYSWQNYINESKTYVNGIITSHSFISKKNNKKSIQSTSKKINTGCIDWFWDTYLNGQLIDEWYLGTTCDDPNSCQSNAIRNSKGTLSVKMNCVSGDGGYVALKITNNVKDTCLHKMVDATINDNITTQINLLIQSVFGSSSKMNISFVDVNTLAQGTEGHTEPPNGLDANGNYNIEIQLNSNSLPNDSQQYIATVIMHEALHAFMLANNIPPLEQHEDMAIDYVTKMASSLQQMFYQLSDADAKNLALGGLFTTETFKYTIANNMSLLGSFDATQLAYSTGSSGLRCK